MTDEQIIEMANKAGLNDFFSMLIVFAKLVAEHEREACAKLCDKLEQQVCNMWHGQACAGCAVTIRARGQRTPEGGEA